MKEIGISVLNLVINGWPSIHKTSYIMEYRFNCVLNLVINGWPSIHGRTAQPLGPSPAPGF